jgi:hypothetical protein
MTVKFLWTKALATMAKTSFIQVFSHSPNTPPPPPPPKKKKKKTISRMYEILNLNLTWIFYQMQKLLSLILIGCLITRIIKLWEKYTLLS